MTRSILKLCFLLAVFFAIAGISAYLTLSLVIESEETVVVPALKSKNAIAVLELLSDLGLNTKVKGSAYSADIARHHVIYQDPKPGTMIKKGRDVKIVLSKGMETFATPDLVNVERRQAEVIISNNGLSTGVVTETFCKNVKKDFVVAQTPAAGAAINHNDAVNLLVSLGSRPPEYVMPDLSGLSLEEAVQIVEKYGLSVGQVHTVNQKGRPANIIIDQKPFSGYYVQPNQTVELSVNRWRRQDEGKPYANDRDVLFRYQIPPGILKQHIRLELKAFGISSTIYDELMAPGREIWLMVPQHTDVAVFLYKNENLIQTEIY